MTQQRKSFIQAQERALTRAGVAAESRDLQIPSIRGRAHALIAGDGPPVVMINGIGTPGAMWAPLMAHLSGLRQIALDLPAYGLTDPAPQLAADLPSGAVRFLTDALDALGLDRPAFVANSMGSLWTSWLALDQPQRVPAMVHIGCPALALETSAPPPMRLLSVRPLGRLLTRLQPPSPRQVEQLSRMVKQHPLPPEIADLLLATEQMPGFRETFLRQVHAMLRLRGSRPALQLTQEQLAQIPQPTLLVWGRDDPFGAPAVGRRMAQVMPSAELHVVDGGHAPWLSAPDRIAPLVRQFLGSARQPAPVPED